MNKSLNFEVTHTVFGVQNKRELKEGGANIPVTSENKEEYTRAYVKWALVDSIAQQYDEFERGFMAVTAPEQSSPESSRFCGTLDLLRPEELELLLDQRATREAMLGTWERYLEHAESGDTIIVTFAGHGANEPAYNPSLESDGRDETFAAGQLAVADLAGEVPG